MTEQEKQMCRNIAAIMRVKRLGAKWIAPQARLSSGALQEIIAGKRKVTGEEAALLAAAMDVPYGAIYAKTTQEAIADQFTPRNGKRIAKASERTGFAMTQGRTVEDAGPYRGRGTRKKGW